MTDVIALVAQVKPAPSTTLANPAQGLVQGVSNLGDGCAPDSSWVCQRVFDWTGNATAAGAAEWFVAKPLAIVIVVLVALLANRLARAAIGRSMKRMLAEDSRRVPATAWLRQKTPDVLLATETNRLRTEARVQTLNTVFRSLASVAIWIVAVVVILEVLEVNLAPLIASAGIIGVALGFGAQNIVRDFLAGTFMVIEDQFGVGDIVDLGGDAKGTVEKVTLRSTRLRDVEGVVWHVPNGQVQRVGNKSQEWARAVLDVTVSYDTDLDEAQRILRRVANHMAGEEKWQAEIIETPEVWGAEAFSADGVTLRVVIKTQPASQFGVMREIRARIKLAFEADGVELAGARDEVWIHQVPPPDGATA